MFTGKPGLLKKIGQADEGGFTKFSHDRSEASVSIRSHGLKDERTNPTSIPAATNENSNKENRSRDNSTGSNEDGRSAKNMKDELKESRSKLKIMTTKFSNVKKEKDNLQKENKQLQEEVMTLQSSLRQMIPGFANTGASFPMLNELVNSVSEFYKYECEDTFFDLLCPELNMKGIVLFFSTCFEKMTETVQKYFAPSEQLIKKTTCISTLEGPIMNVLRKSCQPTWRTILKQCFPQSIYDEVINEIQTHLKLGGCSQQMHDQIQLFLQKMGELALCFYISDPPLAVDHKQIGTKVVYNTLKHEPLDGFIKNKDECTIILPPIYKSTCEGGELMAKALVLQVNYEIPN